METLDVARARQIWNEGLPGMPSIDSDADMLVTLHLARTRSSSIAKRLRYYSHCWLIDRGLQSVLPDELKPAAERMYPRIVSSVGISVNSGSSLLKPAIPIIRTSMEEAVLEVYADNRGDDIPFVRERMSEAKRKAVRKLFGRIRRAGDG